MGLIARSAWSKIIMPKEIVNTTIDRPNTSVPWGFVIIGGKDQSLTVKIGKVKPYSPAENAGLKSHDYLHMINGKEVFEMTHNQCVEMIKSSETHYSSQLSEVIT